MNTVRVFREIHDARAAGFSGPRLRDPDQPNVIPYCLEAHRIDRLRGVNIGRVVVEPEVYLTTRQLAELRAAARHAPIELWAPAPPLQPKLMTPTA